MNDTIQPNEEEKEYKLFARRAYMVLGLLFITVLIVGRSHALSLEEFRENKNSQIIEYDLDENEVYVQKIIQYENKIQQNLSELKAVSSLPSDKFKSKGNYITARINLIDSMIVEVINLDSIPVYYQEHYKVIIELMEVYQTINNNFNLVHQKQIKGMYGDTDEHIEELDQLNKESIHNLLKHQEKLSDIFRLAMERITKEGMTNEENL